jgi:hypothetical protein
MIDLTGQANVALGPAVLAGSAGNYGGHSNWNISDSGEGGVKLYGTKKARLRDIDLSNISGTGIDVQASTAWQDYALLSGIFGRDCYRVMHFRNGGEYAQVNGAKVVNSVYGVHVDSGNVHFTNLEAVNCSIGILVSGGTNNAHGTFTGGSVTHCANLLSCQQVTLGETFSNMNFIGGQGGNDQGAIQLINSKGIVILGGQISYADVSVDATSQLYLRGVTLRGPVNFTVATGGTLDAKDNIVMAGATVTLNGAPWNGGN